MKTWMTAWQRVVSVGWALLLVSVPLAAAHRQPLDQHGAPQPWRGSDDAYTVLDFAASWCAPCWRTLPKLAAFAAEHPELRVLVVSVDEDEEGRTKLVRELGLTLPVLWDVDYRIAETYHPEAMPATVVLAPGGKEIHRHLGSDWEELERYLGTLADRGQKKL